MTNTSELAAEFIKIRRMPLPVIDAHAHMGANYGTYMSKATPEGMIEIMDQEILNPYSVRLTVRFLTP